MGKNKLENPTAEQIERIEKLREAQAEQAANRDHRSPDALRREKQDFPLGLGDDGTPNQVTS